MTPPVVTVNDPEQSLPGPCHHNAGRLAFHPASEGSQSKPALWLRRRKWGRSSSWRHLFDAETLAIEVTYVKYIIA
jgi:hypothetical protein